MTATNHLVRFLSLCPAICRYFVTADGLDGQVGPRMVYQAGFETGAFDWKPSGAETTIVIDGAEKHSGRASAKVTDLGRNIGQANPPSMPVRPGMVYVVSLWVRVDPGLSGRALIDVTLWDAHGKDVASKLVGRVEESGKWTRVSARLRLPETVRSVQLRVVPAPGSVEGHGACWIDDVVIQEWTANQFDDARRKEAARVQVSQSDPDGIVGSPPPVLVANPTAAPPLVDFEDLSGWSIWHPKGMEASFSRSQYQPLEGKYVGKLTYTTTRRDQWVEVVPPSPIVIDQPFDAVEMWVYLRTHKWVTWGPLMSKAPSLTVTIEDADGKRINAEMTVIRWSNWSVSRAKLKSVVKAPARFISFTMQKLPLPGDYTYEPDAPEPKLPRIFCFDSLTFYREHTNKIDLPVPTDLPFPTRPETILPSNHTGQFTNRASRQGDGFVLSYEGGDARIRYEYLPRTGALPDIKAYVGDRGPYDLFAGGGVSLDVDGRIAPPGDRSVTATLVSCKLQGDAVEAKWRLASGAVSTRVTYRLAIKQKSLVLDLSSPDGSIARVGIGTLQMESGKVRALNVPFMLYSSSTSPAHAAAFLVDDRFFVSRLWDWYAMSGSGMRGSGTVVYDPKTDGRRNALSERVFVTVSPDFTEALPNIPNPPSGVAKKFAKYVWGSNLLMFRHDEPLDIGFAKLCRRYGMPNIFFKMHLNVYVKADKWGWEPAMLTDRAAEDEAAFQAFLKRLQGLGFPVCLYSDYNELDPVGRFWNEDHVLVLPNGQWRIYWRHCYCLSPLARPVVCRALSQSIARKFGPNLVYDDEITSNMPWSLIDMDARKPEAGKVSAAYRANGSVPLIEKEIYGGPSFSEGVFHWLYAGLFDGSYAQSPLNYRTTPWLVDFDLLKMHPLQTDIAMGFSPTVRGKETKYRSWDMFLAASIA